MMNFKIIIKFRLKFGWEYITNANKIFEEDKLLTKAVETPRENKPRFNQPALDDKSKCLKCVLRMRR